MTKVLHLIQSLTAGGAGRALLAVAKYSAKQGQFEHRVLSLYPVQAAALEIAKQSQISVVAASAGHNIREELIRADIVHLHFWNNPELYDFLFADLPELRLLLWFHIAGNQPPQMITQNIVDFSDFALACSPYTFENPQIQKVHRENQELKTGMVLGAADFERIGNPQPKPHSGFNVGYVGTVDFVKMHPRFIPMSASVSVPDVRFIVCGDGIQKLLHQQAQQLGAADRFEFRGYVDDVRSVLESLDIYGYPLCEDTYAAAELNLQEVMFAGIPPVVFPYGGVKRLVEHDRTGLIVNSEREYKEAIEHLYHNPEDLARLGKQAREYASLHFGAENAAKALNPVYQTMMSRSKRRRVWGAVAGVSLLNQPVTLRELLDPPSKQVGARMFVESLGDASIAFVSSMEGEDIQEVLASERAISKSSPLLRSQGSGGILHYRGYYPKDPHLRLWSALILLECQQVEDAAAEFLSARELGLQHWRIDWYLSKIEKIRGNLHEAERLLEKVVEAAPDFEEAKTYLRTEPGSSTSASDPVSEALDRADQCFRKDDLHGASGFLIEALRVAPDRLDLHISLGSTLFQLGDFQGALQRFEQGIRIHPSDASLYVHTASTHLKLSHIQEFETALKRALELDPGNRLALSLAASHDLMEGRFERAAQTYGKLVEQTPDDLDTLLPLGVCFFKIRDFVTAETLFERILEIQPDHQLAAENLEAVQLSQAVKKR